MEESSVLRHIGDFFTERDLFDLLDILAINLNLTFLNIRKAQKKFRECRLAGTRKTNETNSFACLHIETKVIKDGAWRIGMLKTNCIKLNSTFTNLNILCSSLVLHGIFGIQNLSHIVRIAKDAVNRLQNIVNVPKVTEDHGCVLRDKNQSCNIHTQLRTEGFKHRRSNNTGNQYQAKPNITDNYCTHLVHAGVIGRITIACVAAFFVRLATIGFNRQNVRH